MAYLPPLNGGRLNASIAGNTAGASTLLSYGTMVLAGGNNVTLSQNGSTISFNAAGAAQGSVNFSASNASANLASVNFANSYNMSFGLTNGSQIYGSASFSQSTQSQNNIAAVSAGTASAATGTVVFANANGVGFGLNGNTITASYSTPPAASNVIGASGGNVSGNVGTINSSNFSYVFAGGNNITLSQSITSNSATLSISGPSFANANNVTLGISNNGVVTGSASFSQSVQTQTIQAAFAGNTSGTLATISAGTMVLAGGNNVTLSQSNNTVTVSGPSFANSNGFAFGTNAGNVTASYTGAGYLNVSASGSAQSLSALSFANSNSITFGLSNGVITASASPDGIQGVMAAGSTVGTGSISFSNANNINFGLNGSILTASANVAGGGLAVGANNSTFSTGTLGLNAGGGISFSTAAQSLTISAPPVSSISATNLTVSTNGSVINFSGPAMFDAGVSNLGNTIGNTGVLTNTNGLILVGGNNVTLSQSVNNANAFVTINAGGGGATISNWEPNILQNVSLSNSSLGARNLFFFKLQVPGNVYASQLLQLISASPSTTNSTAAYSVSMQAGIYVPSGSSLSLLTQSSGSTSFSFTASSTSGSTNWNSIRGVSLPMSVSFSGGNYWIGVWSNTTYANMSATLQNMLVVNNTNALSYGGFFNQASAASQGVQEAVGYYSNTSSGLASLMPMSQIVQSNIASIRMPYFNFKNTVW